MELVLLCTLVVLLLSSEVSTKNSYVITAPKTFRPGMFVNMTVLILKEDTPGTPVHVNATFFIDSIAVVSAVGQFHAGVTGTLQLPIPSEGLPEKSSSYESKKHLQVTGSGGLIFNSSSGPYDDVRFDKKGFSIYVQTDKGIYKPRQTVHMRVLAVYPNLKVYMGKITVGITDPKGNKLAYWKDEMTASGVVTKDFELSSQPNMGDWKISVEIEGRKEETTFEVKEYVLPKFKVDVVTNTYASTGNGDIQGSASAKYTYGKGVKGKAKVMVYFSCYLYGSCKADVTEYEIDGSLSFTISKKKIVNLFKSYSSYGDPYGGWYQVIVNVSVTDQLTQKTQFGDTTVRLHRSSVVLKYSETNPKAFKPSFPFQALIEVTRPDGTPITNGNVKVQVTTSTSPVTDEQEASHTTDENGYIVMKQTITKDVRSFYIQAEAVDEFGEKTSLSEYLSKFESKSNTYLTATAVSYEVQAGEEIVCHVVATEGFSSLNYLVVSRGNTIVSNSVPNPLKVNSATLRLPTSSIMSPSAKIVVYFVRDNGEIVSDSLTIKVNGAFENEVSVQFSTRVSKPGESINVNVKASPYSQVGLLAVDQSVLLLKKGNDFSVQQVMEELNSYGGDSSSSFPHWWGWRRRRKRSFFPWYPSAQNSQEIFEGAGVAVLTDCEGFKRDRFPIMYRYDEVLDLQRLSLISNRAPNLADVQKVRTFFPETWLWKNVETNSLGRAKVSTTTPDTITSWVLSGFAVSNVTGFGVVNDKPQLRVFQPFFLSMDLPYSVIRGEQVAIKVILFNYENTDMKVTVTLRGSGDWKYFNETDNDVSGQETNAGRDVTSNIMVPANSGAGVSFPIIPLKLGNIPITVSAQSTTSADAVKRNLLVQPEGVEQEYSYSLLLDLAAPSTDFFKELELALPSNAVEGSAKGTISVIGDIMGSSINGIEKLLKMPYGCGEQNMINFAPSMFIRAYLENVGQLTPNIKEKSIRFMTSGYQRELTYQHRDGSYSAFGERYGRTGSGSLWLTAFVVKSFSRAKSYIYIDHVSMGKSIEFMLSRQRKDGSFEESGSVSSYLQGGLKSSNPEALTAYVLVSLLESGNNSPEVRQRTSNAVQFLKIKLRTITDAYTLAIVAYAMELANDPAKEAFLNELLKKAVREDGTLHWTEESSEKKKPERWFRPYYQPRSADIEITSYALLVYAHRGEKQNGLPIARWLAQQRNSLGGYSSTQDTVVGLQALSEFAPLVFSPDISFNVDVKLSSDASFKKSFHVDKNNMIVLQEEELPTVSGTVLVSGHGKGIGVLQVGVTYNVDKPPSDKFFDLVVRVIEADNNKVKTQSCVKYSGDGQKSGMAILDFGLPSGFNIDQDDVNELLFDENNKIKRIETPGRKAILYFDEVLKTESLCVNLRSVRTHAVGRAQPIPVVIYDYYNPEKRATIMYATQENVGLCDVCLDCTNCKPRGVGAASHVISFSQLLMIGLAIMMYNF